MRKQPEKKETLVQWDGQVVLKNVGRRNVDAKGHETERLADDRPRNGVKQRFDPFQEITTTFLGMLRERKARAAVRYAREMGLLTNDGFRLPNAPRPEPRADLFMVAGDTPGTRAEAAAARAEGIKEKIGWSE